MICVRLLRTGTWLLSAFGFMFGPAVTKENPRRSLGVDQDLTVSVLVEEESISADVCGRGGSVDRTERKMTERE